MLDPKLNVPDIPLDLVCQWVKRCMGGSHIRCRSYRQPKTNRSRPSRLLCLSRYQDGIVQLIEPGLNEHQSDYVTLSHRWGVPAPPKLSATTGDEKIALDIFKRGIEISVLPQLFQDAIRITYACELQYIWIDSLCIIQDKTGDGDNEDWQQEALIMGDIYAGAVL